MPMRHTVYCKQSTSSVTPQDIMDFLEPADFLTLGEDYGLSEAEVRSALPLRVEAVRSDPFGFYRLTYGTEGTRPLEIDRAEKEEHLGMVQERIEILPFQDRERKKAVVEFLNASVDSVSVAFGVDPAAAMFAWEVVRYFASQFEGIVHADDGDWLSIGPDFREDAY